MATQHWTEVLSMATMRVCVYFSNDNLETFDIHGTLRYCNEQLADAVDKELMWQFPVKDRELYVSKVTTDWRPS